MRRRESLEFCPGVYSALGTSPTSINVFPLPLPCGHLSSCALCPRTGFPAERLFIATGLASTGGEWSASRFIPAHLCPCFLCGGYSQPSLPPMGGVVACKLSSRGLLVHYSTQWSLSRQPAGGPGCAWRPGVLRKSLTALIGEA